MPELTVDRRYLLGALLIAVSSSFAGAGLAHGSAIADIPSAPRTEPTQTWAGGTKVGDEPDQIDNATAMTAAMGLGATESAKAPPRPRGEAFDVEFVRAPVSCPEVGARSRRGS